MRLDRVEPDRQWNPLHLRKPCGRHRGVHDVPGGGHDLPSDAVALQRTETQIPQISCADAPHATIITHDGPVRGVAARPRHRRNRACRMAPALVRAPAQPGPHHRGVEPAARHDGGGQPHPRRHRGRAGAGTSVGPLPIRLGGVVVFGGRRLTLARLVVPTTELLTLQRIVYELIADCEGVPLHIVPGEWTPHVTLSRRIQSTDLGTAVVVTRAGSRDVVGTSAGIRRWDSDDKREWRITRHP
ncbi:hypothetical protein GS485_20285 [Rhodococcus hoagii]|nr:hypothetical protein [Prescottella equi]